MGGAAAPDPARCGRVAAALAALGAAVFPARCLHCRRLLPVAPGAAPETPPAPEDWRLLQAHFCDACLSSVTPVEPPFCPRCGEMFKSREGVNHACGRCLQTPPPFRMARAAFAYDRSLVDVLHCFKYKGKTRLAEPLGRLLWRAFRRHWGADPVELILPVPLHRRRLRRRGFNQSELLLREWRRCAPPGEAPAILSGVLVRAAATAAQAGLSRREREVNIRGAFRLARPELVNGRHVLLVDDVITTGATAGECARVLLAGGAARVDVLALARVA